MYYELQEFYAGKTYMTYVYVRDEGGFDVVRQWWEQDEGLEVEEKTVCNMEDLLNEVPELEKWVTQDD